MGSMRKEEKLVAALAQLRERLIANAIAPAVAEQIESDLHSLANYGFPESHAWSFALIAYVTAWLKTHHHHRVSSACECPTWGSTRQR